MENDEQNIGEDTENNEPVRIVDEILGDVVDKCTHRELDIPQQDNLSDLPPVALEGLLELKIVEQGAEKQQGELNEAFSVVASQAPMMFPSPGVLRAVVSGLSTDLENHQQQPLCLLCGKTFKNTRNLKFHMLSHQGMRPFTCTFCPKSFSQKNVLDQHLASHTGLKPFKCDKCEKAFTQRSALYRHTKLHENPELANTQDFAETPEALIETFGDPELLEKHTAMDTELMKEVLENFEDSDTCLLDHTNASVVKAVGS